MEVKLQGDTDMAWCSKCKMEYISGITVCPDCGEPLTEKEDGEPQEFQELYLGSEGMAVRLVEYLKYSQIDSACLGETELVENPEAEGEELEVYRVLVEKKQFKEAEKLAKVFVYHELASERERAISEQSETDRVESSMSEENKEQVTIEKKQQGPYVKKAEQYEDLHSSAVTFLLVGFCGILFVILSATGLLPLSFGAGKYLVYFVMGAMFVIFLLVGFSSFKSAKKVKEQIAEEENQTQEILHWFLKEYSAEQIDRECGMEENLAEELCYFERSEFMKRLLLNKLEEAQEAYAEELVEQLYQEIYEK